MTNFYTAHVKTRINNMILTADADIVEKARKIKNEDKIFDIKDLPNCMFKAKVKGENIKNKSTVELCYSQRKRKTEKCTCSYSNLYGKPCEHIIAVALKAIELIDEKLNNPPIEEAKNNEYNSEEEEEKNSGTTNNNFSNSSEFVISSVSNNIKPVNPFYPVSINNETINRSLNLNSNLNNSSFNFNPFKERVNRPQPTIPNSLMNNPFIPQTISNNLQSANRGPEYISPFINPFHNVVNICLSNSNNNAVMDSNNINSNYNPFRNNQLNYNTQQINHKNNPIFTNNNLNNINKSPYKNKIIFNNNQNQIKSPQLELNNKGNIDISSSDFKIEALTDIELSHLLFYETEKEVYAKGYDLFDEDFVHESYYAPPDIILGKVKGDTMINVKIELIEKELHCYCACFSSGGKSICKHIIAIAIYFDCVNEKIIKKVEEFEEDEQKDINENKMIIVDSSEEESDNKAESFKDGIEENEFEDEEDVFSETPALSELEINSYKLYGETNSEIKTLRMAEKSLFKKEPISINMNEINEFIEKVLSLCLVPFFTVEYTASKILKILFKSIKTLKLRLKLNEIKEAVEIFIDAFSNLAIKIFDEFLIYDYDLYEEEFRELILLLQDTLDDIIFRYEESERKEISFYIKTQLTSLLKSNFYVDIIFLGIN